MMKFSDIPAYLRDRYAARYQPEGVRVLADAYWKTLLALAAIAVIGALAWGAVDLFSVLGALSGEPDTSPLPPAALSRPALQKVVQGFEDRQTQFQALQTAPLPNIADPSK